MWLVGWVGVFGFLFFVYWFGVFLVGCLVGWFWFFFVVGFVLFLIIADT